MPHRSWASLAALILASLPLTACDTGNGPGEGARLTVYVSLPSHGPDARGGRDAMDGARLALAESGGRAAGVPVRGVFLDEGDGPAGWDPVRVAANARRAAEDSTAIAYIGDFSSGATRVSLPVTNQAEMLQVSPASAAVDLVQPFPGSSHVPDDTQPSGDRTFGRVIPDDEAQAQAGALWAKRLGARHAFTASDRSAFGQEMTGGFSEEAKMLGLSVRRTSLARTSARCATASILGGPVSRLVYFGGASLSAPALSCLIAGLQASPLMGTDALLSPGALPLPATAHPLDVTSAAQAPSQLPPAGRRFVRAFHARYHREPGRYAAYGYEAMSVVLASISAADEPTSRGSVISSFFAVRDRESVLGTYSIDDVGNTTLGRVTGLRLAGGRERVEAALRVP